MTKRQAKLSEQIRAAVDASGMGRNEIARLVGVDKGGMSRFMAGKGGLEMAKLDALAALLKVEVTFSKAGKKADNGKHRK